MKENTAVIVFWVVLFAALFGEGILTYAGKGPERCAAACTANNGMKMKSYSFGHCDCQEAK